MHAPHLGQLTPLAPALAPGSRGQLGNEDGVGVGGVQHAPGSGLVRRQAIEVGKVLATAFPHATATSCRACHGIEPHRAELLAADAAVARFSHVMGIQHTYAWPIDPSRPAFPLLP
jgi:hypothetical protein